jgi:hypothetical protein
MYMSFPSTASQKERRMAFSSDRYFETGFFKLWACVLAEASVLRPLRGPASAANAWRLAQRGSWRSEITLTHAQSSWFAGVVSWNHYLFRPPCYHGSSNN